MTRQLMDRFLGALRARYPDYPLSVREYTSPDDPTIESFIDILLVPADKLHDVAWDAWSLAGEVYGDEPIHFLMTTVDPESSVEYFHAELEAVLGAAAETTDSNGFPTTLVSQRSGEPVPWGSDGFVVLCAAIAAAYWTNTDWDEPARSAPSEDPFSPVMDCDLGEDDSIVLPGDPLESSYPIAA